MTQSRMPEVMRKIKDFLEKSNQRFDKDTIAKAINEPESTTYKALKKLDASGVLIVDRTHRLWLWSWKKGAVPAFYKAFPLWNDPQRETNWVREQMEKILSTTGEDWMIRDTNPPRTWATWLVLAGVAGIGEKDQDAIIEYDEWLSETVEALRPMYNAFRVLAVINAMPDKKRMLKEYSITLTKDEFNVDLALILRQARKDCLAGLKRIKQRLPAPTAESKIEEVLPEPVEVSETPAPFVPHEVPEESVEQLLERMAREHGEENDIWNQ